MWIMFLYRIDVGPLSDRYADIPTSYRYLSDMGMLTGNLASHCCSLETLVDVDGRSRQLVEVEVQRNN